MKKFILIIILIFALATPASAMEFTAPTVPSDAAQIVPEEPQSFGEGLTDGFCQKDFSVPQQCL